MPQLIKKVSDLIELTNNINSEDIGVIPTMGNLHEGHISLVDASLQDNKVSIVTIFVNPKQFGPNEDFDKYPRTLGNDLEQLSKLPLKEDQKLYVFAPDSVKEIYPSGFSTTISIDGVSTILCGAKRPGHFDGVTTVVYQLFKLTNASQAYFGQKDYQQTMLIEQMIHDLRLDVNLNMLPISRDDDGLARSSRNRYLTQETRQEALQLTGKVKKISELLQKKNWVEVAADINLELESIINDQRWDYLEVLDANNLQEVSSKTSKVVILGALRVQSARLIDNRLVDISYA